MNTLFLVQFACCIIVSMLGLILVLSRFQIRWTNRRYEVSRWLLAFSMFVLAGHYVLQMVYGFRAKGDEIGAVVNVLFYSPVSFFISYATYNLICYRGGRKKFALLGCVSYALILICFFFGYNDTPRGMHMGEWLYVMLALFAVTIMYSTYTTVIEMRYHRKIIEENTTEDLLPFDRYTYTTYGLAGIMVLAMVGAICYRPLLYCVGPLMLFSLISFTISFLGYGYNMIPAEVRLELDTADEPLEVMEESEEVGLGSEKISIIESMLASWCDKGGYRDCTINMPMLSVKLGIPRNELSLYFENYLKSSFRSGSAISVSRRRSVCCWKNAGTAMIPFLQNAASPPTPISIRFSRLRRDLHQDNGETLFGKTGSLMWMDYKNYLEGYDNKHFHVLDAYM